jgi:hypothetical protein
MPGKSKQPQIPLPKSWGTHVKSAVSFPKNWSGGNHGGLIDGHSESAVCPGRPGRCGK